MIDEEAESHECLCMDKEVESHECLCMNNTVIESHEGLYMINSKVEDQEILYITNIKGHQDLSITNIKVESQENLYMTAVFNIGSSHDLKDLFILDSGATSHVCNNFSRFINFKNNKSTLVAGETTSMSPGSGEVRVYPNLVDKQVVLILTNIKYVPGIITNVVSYRLLKNAGYR